MKKTNIPDYIRRRLPKHHWKLLREVPTWEGVLYYDPLDFLLDRPLTFYRRLHCPQLREDIIFPLRVYEFNSALWYIKHGGKRRPMYRRQIKFSWKPNLLPGRDSMKYLQCSQLTMLCLTGFAIADPRHWVVDHIDGNPLNDRPSNLQVISQSENCRRSQRFMEQARENARKTNAALAAARSTRAAQR